MKKIFITILLLFQLIGITQAQTSFTSSEVQKTLLPHSPNAESLGKYGDIPVGLYTGVPNVSVPLYEMKMKGFSLPISIDYHSAGIKVDEIASDVGLGWSLNAGGVINQIVYGKPDWGNWVNSASSNAVPLTGLLQTDFDITSAWSTNPAYLFNKYATDGIIDTQPDIYSFSLPGKSGKFFFDQSGSVHLIPSQNLKIAVNLSPASGIAGFTITDEKGIKYVFSDSEISITALYTCYFTPGNLPTTTSSLYLSKIITPAGDEVDFHYHNSNYTLQDQISETRYHTPSSTISGNPHVSDLPNCTVTSTTQVFGLFLDSITNATTKERIVLTYATTDRTDVPGAKALVKIEVFNKDQLQIKRFDLAQDYFLSTGGATDALNNRLRLNSIQQNGQQPYLFTYNATPLPPRLSFAQDHWGYYNGQSNTTLLPNENNLYFDTGANRDPDSTFIKAGVLTKIVYPTGGYTNFDYEPNDSYVDQNISSYQNNFAGGTAIANGTRTISFTVAENSLGFRVQWNQNAESSSEDGEHNSNGDNTTITLSGPANAAISFGGSENFNGHSAGIVNLFGVPLDQVSLLPGNYTVTITNTNYSGIPVGEFFNIYWKTSVTTHVQANQFAGGLRVKSISDNSLTGSVKTKHFVYRSVANSAISSGVLQYTPAYESDYYTRTLTPDGINLDGNPIYMVTDAKYLSQSSGSLAPLGTIQGGNVIYTNVTTYENDKSNGYTNNEFLGSVPGAGAPFSGDLPAVYPSPPATNTDWLNGLPSKKTEFKFNPVTNAYFPVHIQKNSYKTAIGDGSSQYTSTGNGADVNESFVRGIKVAYIFPEWHPAPNTAYEPAKFSGIGDLPATFAIGYYHLYASWYHLDHQTDTLYNLNGTNPVITNTDYYYDNAVHTQLTRTVTAKSDGKLLTSVNTYPDDYAAGTTFLDDMKANHLTGLPVEQATYQYDGANTSILGGIITQYKTGGKGLIDQVYKLETTAPVPLSSFKFSNAVTGQFSFGNTPGAYNFDSRYQQPRLTYNLYDILGNPLMVTQDVAPPVTYLWGYNYQYPIAEIKNATYTDVVNVLTQATIDQLAGSSPGSDATVRSTLNALRTATALQNAQVTTYTYIPGVGMTSATDAKGETTYYEYDTFQRLMNVKDKDGNIVKHIDYHYQQ